MMTMLSIQFARRVCFASIVMVCGIRPWRESGQKRAGHGQGEKDVS